MSTFGDIRQWAQAGCPQATRPEVTCPICHDTDLCLPGPGAPAYNPAEELVEDDLEVSVEGRAGPAATWEKMAVLPCGHMIGFTCLMEWVAYRRVRGRAGKVCCPLCMFELSCECPGDEADSNHPVECSYAIICPKMIEPGVSPDALTRVPLTVSEGTDVGALRAQVLRGCAGCLVAHEACRRALKAWRRNMSRAFITSEERPAAEARFRRGLTTLAISVMTDRLGESTSRVWCCMPVAVYDDESDADP